MDSMHRPLGVWVILIYHLLWLPRVIAGIISVVSILGTHPQVLSDLLAGLAGIAGAIALFTFRKISVTLFIVAALLNVFYYAPTESYIFSSPPDKLGATLYLVAILYAMPTIISIGAFFYARILTKKGILK